MTDHDDLRTLRRYARAEAALKLNIPDSWLKVWVTERRVPHQRSGKPGPRQRGVWFTYADIEEIGRMLPSLMSGRQANSRAEDAGVKDRLDGERGVAVGVAAEGAELDFARFLNLKSIR